jgi:hypothetical protein
MLGIVSPKSAYNMTDATARILSPMASTHDSHNAQDQLDTKEVKVNYPPKGSMFNIDLA